VAKAAAVTAAAARVAAVIERGRRQSFSSGSFSNSSKLIEIVSSTGLEYWGVGVHRHRRQRRAERHRTVVGSRNPLPERTRSEHRPSSVAFSTPCSKANVMRFPCSKANVMRFLRNIQCTDSVLLGNSHMMAHLPTRSYAQDTIPSCTRTGPTNRVSSC